MRPCKQWELEAAVAILKGQPIPPARQRHLRNLSLSAWDNGLFEALKQAGVSLRDVYVDPEETLRDLKLTEISALTGLQELHLSHTPVSNWSPVDHVDFVNGRPKDWRRKSRG